MEENVFSLAFLNLVNIETSLVKSTSYGILKYCTTNPMVLVIVPGKDISECEHAIICNRGSAILYSSGERQSRLYSI